MSDSELTEGVERSLQLFVCFNPSVALRRQLPRKRWSLLAQYKLEIQKPPCRGRWLLRQQKTEGVEISRDERGAA